MRSDPTPCAPHLRGVASKTAATPIPQELITMTTINTLSEGQQGTVLAGPHVGKAFTVARPGTGFVGVTWNAEGGVWWNGGGGILPALTPVEVNQ
jgi:hypothetical protein